MRRRRHMLRKGERLEKVILLTSEKVVSSLEMYGKDRRRFYGLESGKQLGEFREELVGGCFGDRSMNGSQDKLTLA